MSTHELCISLAIDVCRDGGKPYVDIRFWWESQKEKRPLGRPIHRGEDNIKNGSYER
jgi:hypothetical protein